MTIAVLAGVFVGLVSVTGWAQPFPVESLPPELEPWTAWVLDEAPNHPCVAVNGSAVCVWPGRLTLDLHGAGGRFSVSVSSPR